MIDLRSDTVTRPTPAMLDAMMQAPVGDDVLGDDPSVQELQNKASRLFGMEAALFCPSGTMTNQLAINVHTRPGDEVICHQHSHVYFYEGGGMMRHSGVSVRLLNGPRGMVRAEEIEPNINPDDDHRPVTSLVEIENTSNKGGGAIYAFQEIQQIAALCKKNGLKLHLDGARLFNALVETGDSPLAYGELFDSISICLSKGLGAPVGSLLLGNSEFIKQAKRARKAFGGGMRQSGYLAAAGIYALENNIDRLKEDHRKARHLGEILRSHPLVEEVLPADTNILIFKLTRNTTAKEFLERLKKHNIWALATDSQTIRFVTHLDITDPMMDQIIHVLKTL